MPSVKNGLPNLASAVQAWMTDEGWEDEIEVAEDNSSSRVTTAFSINDQSYKLFIETNEEAPQLFIYMYSPFKVPPAKMPEMARLMNMINCVFNAGRLACYDDEDSNPVQFLWKIPVLQSELTAAEVGSMVSAAVDIFDRYGGLLAQCVFANRTAKDIWAEYLSERNAVQDDS